MPANQRAPITHHAAVNLAHLVSDINIQAEIALTSPVFGCYTRSAVDVILNHLDLTGLSLVYFDVDNLRQHNDQLGKAETNQRICAALAHRETDVVISQWFSGDEFIALIPTANAFGLAGRLLRNFKEQYMSATFVIAECDEFSMLALVEACDFRVQTLKATGMRGVIAAL